MGIGWNGPTADWADARTINEQRQEIRNLMNDRDAVVRQRDDKVVAGVAWAQTAKALAKELGVEQSKVKDVYKQARQMVEDDFQRRGAKEFHKNPTKLNLTIKK